MDAFIEFKQQTVYTLNLHSKKSHPLPSLHQSTDSHQSIGLCVHTSLCKIMVWFLMFSRIQEIECVMRLNTVISRTQIVCLMFCGCRAQVYACMLVIWFLWRVTKVIRANIVSTFWPLKLFFLLIHSLSLNSNSHLGMLSGQMHHSFSSNYLAFEVTYFWYPFFSDFFFHFSFQA